MLLVIRIAKDSRNQRPIELDAGGQDHDIPRSQRGAGCFSLRHGSEDLIAQHLQFPQARDAGMHAQRGILALGGIIHPFCQEGHVKHSDALLHPLKTVGGHDLLLIVVVAHVAVHLPFIIQQGHDEMLPQPPPACEQWVTLFHPIVVVSGIRNPFDLQQPLMTHAVQARSQSPVLPAWVGHKESNQGLSRIRPEQLELSGSHVAHAKDMQRLQQVRWSSSRLRKPVPQSRHQGATMRLMVLLQGSPKRGMKLPGFGWRSGNTRIRSSFITLPGHEPVRTVDHVPGEETGQAIGKLEAALRHIGRIAGLLQIGRQAGIGDAQLLQFGAALRQQIMDRPAQVFLVEA